MAIFYVYMFSIYNVLDAFCNIIVLMKYQRFHIQNSHMGLIMLYQHLETIQQMVHLTLTLFLVLFLQQYSNYHLLWQNLSILAMYFLGSCTSHVIYTNTHTYISLNVLLIVVLKTCIISPQKIPMRGGHTLKMSLG